MRKLIQAATVAIMLTPAVGVAQDFEAGMRAAKAGDFATALKEWRPLADQGNAEAQTGLGLGYYTGDGVPQDYAEAAKWYRLAAEQGNALAQWGLGNMYGNGQGVPQDYAEAVKWYRLAADQGIVKAQFNLGAMYWNGDGVPQDYVAAHMWLNLASTNGLDDAGNRRDELAAKMTPADISEAQRRAKACMASNYQDCD